MLKSEKYLLWPVYKKCKKSISLACLQLKFTKDLPYCELGLPSTQNYTFLRITKPVIALCYSL